MIINAHRCQLTQRPKFMVLKPQSLPDELLLKWICDAAIKANQDGPDGPGFSVTIQVHGTGREFYWACGSGDADDADSGDGLEIGQ